MSDQERTQAWVQVLRVVIRHISQATWRAGWMADAEYHLWRVASGDFDNQNKALAPYRPMLTLLADQCGGWTTASEYVPLPRWRVMFETWQRRQKLAKAGRR